MNQQDELLQEIYRSGDNKLHSVIPCLDGSFIYFPAGMLGKGYKLQPKLAKVLCEELREVKARSKIIDKVILVILVVAGVITWPLEGGLFGIKPWYIFTVVLFLFAIFYMRELSKEKAKQFKVDFPKAFEYEHRFPLDYMMLALDTLPSHSRHKKSMLKLSFMIVAVGWIFHHYLTSTVAFLYLGTFFEPNLSANSGVNFYFSAIFVLPVFGGSILFAIFYLYSKLKFKFVHGREPTMDDLAPIDPATGKMITYLQK